MDIETFDLERGQSLWEHKVAVNLSESGVHPASLAELAELGLDLQALTELPLEYVQTNGTPELRSAISAMYPGSSPEHIEVTNGTSEANLLLAQALIEPGDEVVIQVPNYLQVAGLARSLGASVKTFPLERSTEGPDRQWGPNLDALRDVLSERTKLIYLSHPNNPTGALLSSEEIKTIVELADEVNAIVLADEVYRGAEHSGDLSPSFWGRSPRVVVTAGLSKSYGLPGLRIGWLVAPPDLAAECWRLHDYTTIAPGALSDFAASFAIRPGVRERLWQRARDFMLTNRQQLLDFMTGYGDLFDSCDPEAGAYAFARYDAKRPSVDLCDAIRKDHDVLIVPGTWMGAEYHLRFGLGPPEELFQQGLERIAQTFDQLASSRQGA